MNPIDYLKEHGFNVTSDPTTYRDFYPNGPKSDWGYRNYWERHNGKIIYHDDYCGGWHRAYDLSRYEGAPLPAVVDGFIAKGTSSNGNFGGTVVLCDHEGDYQYIYGHTKNLQVSVGDEVKQGQKLAEQSSTNYYNNPMASHLHFQVQKQGYIPDEKSFVCTGINPLGIDVSKYVGKQSDKKEGSGKVAYTLVNRWLPQNKYYLKAPYAMTPSTLTIHETDNNASADNEASYMLSNNLQVSFHAVADENKVIQLIPFNRNAWAAGDGLNGAGNRRSIHLEITYNKDLGYGGPISDRMEQAIENAALYAAHVLIQYGWGTGHLRRHWDWTRKNCPRKLMLHNRWDAFKKRVKEHMDAINKGNQSAANKPAKKPATSNKSTHTVKRGDTLWGIANANGVTVANLKSWNNLKSNTITIGQKLTLKKKSSTPAKTPKTGGAANIKYDGDWRFNKNTQVYWVPVKAKYTLAHDTYVYDKLPKIIRANRLSLIKAGTTIDVVELCRFVEPSGKSFEWAVYRNNKGQLRYLPIKEWGKRPGKVTNSGLWGLFK